MGSDEMHGFSGTLELLKVLEELVLPDSEDERPKNRSFPGTTTAISRSLKSLGL